jgi:hypothetical protein
MGRVNVLRKIESNSMIAREEQKKGKGNRMASTSNSPILQT